jgi:hypothetical protein
VRREAGEGAGGGSRHGEDVAIRTGVEVLSGQPLSREMMIQGADAVVPAEGKTGVRVNASARPTLRDRRPRHVRTLLARKPGDLAPGRQLRSSVRIGKAASRREGVRVGTNRAQFHAAAARWWRSAASRGWSRCAMHRPGTAHEMTTAVFHRSRHRSSADPRRRHADITLQQPRSPIHRRPSAQSSRRTGSRQWPDQ